MGSQSSLAGERPVALLLTGPTTGTMRSVGPVSVASPGMAQSKRAFLSGRSTPAPGAG